MQACVQGLLRGLPVESARPFRPLPQVSLPVSAPVSVPGQAACACRRLLPSFQAAAWARFLLPEPVGSLPVAVLPQYRPWASQAWE